MSYTFKCELENSDNMKVYLKKDNSVIFENFSSITYPIEYLEPADSGNYACVFRFHQKNFQYNTELIVHGINKYNRI